MPFTLKALTKKFKGIKKTLETFLVEKKKEGKEKGKRERREIKEMWGNT